MKAVTKLACGWCLKSHKKKIERYERNKIQKYGDWKDS